jgi:RNA polymerase sigma factor (sigma-70 family)
MRAVRDGVERINVTEQKAKEMEEWARQVKLPLFLYVRSFRIPVADAWDIVQDVFFYLCAREEPLPDEVNSRKALLLKVAQFRVRAHFNERKRHGERADLVREYAIFAGMTYERDLSAVIEAREQLELVLPALSEDQYEVFTTKVLEGLKVCDVAAQLGLKENTARGYLSKALETLRERLEHLEPRGVRSLLILLGISSILALADTASAMASRIKRFFESFFQATLRCAASAATAVFVMVVPPNSGASADHSANSANLPSRAATNSITLPEAPNPSGAPAQRFAEFSLHIFPISTSIRPQSIPHRDTTTKAVKVTPPDFLLSQAMSAMRNGNPEKALELLDRYPENDLKWADELRTRAKQALAAKKRAQ